MSKKISETAAAGSTGAGSIATVPSRMGAMQTRMSLKDFMIDFYGRVKNRGNFKPVKFGSIKESRIMESNENPFQLDTALSKLKGAEQESSYQKRDSISFGIEDEKDNLMVITIPIQQAEEFEKEVARALADVLAFKKTGDGEDKSLAELLYDLKSKFTIIDAQFPKIPTSAVYNADEISTVSEQDKDTEDNEFDPDTEDEEDAGAEGKEDLGNEEDLENIEDENVSDFDEDQNEVSLLRDVLDLLKTQSEEKIATAKAEEEKAKAMQAKIATKQAYNKLEAEEDMIETEAEMEAKKEKEKEADRLADVLKYRYKNKNENFSSLFKGALLNELDPMDTPQSLRRQMAAIRSKYQPNPGDTPEEKRFKREQMQLAQRELRVKLRAARNRQDYERTQQGEEPEEQQQENKPNREDRVRAQRGQNTGTEQNRGL